MRCRLHSEKICCADIKILSELERTDWLESLTLGVTILHPNARMCFRMLSSLNQL